MSYTVRPLGQAAWHEGVPTFEQAKRFRNEAVRAGCMSVVILDDTGNELLDCGCNADGERHGERCKRFMNGADL